MPRLYQQHVVQLRHFESALGYIDAVWLINKLIIINVAIHFVAFLGYIGTQLSYLCRYVYLNAQNWSWALHRRVLLMINAAWHYIHYYYHHPYHLPNAHKVRENFIIVGLTNLNDNACFDIFIHAIVTMASMSFLNHQFIHLWAIHCV